MAAPLEAADAMCALLPPGPVLELCCGVGGITRALADGRQVLAVDASPARLAACRQNLTRLGLNQKVELVCNDLHHPGLGPPPGLPRFAACVLDPDWSPAGQPAEQWSDDLNAMQPPVEALLRLAFEFSPLTVLRLPPAFVGHVLAREAAMVQEFQVASETKFIWLHLEQGSIGGVWL